MKRYRLIHNDCLKVMSKFPSHSIDLILCDLPYGTTACKWDTVIPFEPLWHEYKRIIKPNHAIVLFGSQPFSSALICSNITDFKYELIWSKNKSSGFLNAKKMPLRSHENIIVFNTKVYNPQMTKGHSPGSKATKKVDSDCYGKSGKSEYGGSTERYPKSVLEYKVVNNDSKDRCHPTQKPVDLLEYLIHTYSTKGQLVLDNCIGSGSTGIAALNLGRRFIGIEKKQQYFDAAKSRIDSHKVIPKLFG